MPEPSERLTLLDAFIKTAEAGCPGPWARFRELAPLLESSGSPEEAARSRLSCINRRYDASQSWVSGGQAGDSGLYEATKIQSELLDQFVRAIHARRWSFGGYLKGDLRPTSVPVERIQASAFRFDANKLCLSDGTEVSDVFVVPAVPPSPSPAETRGGPKGGPAENQPKKRKNRKKPRIRHRADPVQSVAKGIWPLDGKPPKRRRSWRRDPIIAVITQKWGPGWPPDTLATPEALRQLDHELDRLEIKASDDTKKRAMGRRD
jgi:hypothetical protein